MPIKQRAGHARAHQPAAGASQPWFVAAQTAPVLAFPRGVRLAQAHRFAGEQSTIATATAGGRDDSRRAGGTAATRGGEKVRRVLRTTVRLVAGEARRTARLSGVRHHRSGHGREAAPARRAGCHAGRNPRVVSGVQPRPLRAGEIEPRTRSDDSQTRKRAREIGGREGMKVKLEPSGAVVVAPASWTAPALWRFRWQAPHPKSARGLAHSTTLRNFERFMGRAVVLTLMFMALFVGILPTAAATDAETGFDSANRLYEQAKFADAATAYEKLIQAGSISPALLFNLGNACFKSGQIGRAVAAYRQAEQLTPRDPDVRANLQFAQNQVQGPTLRARFWQRGLGTLSLNEWTALASGALWLTFGLLIARQIKPALAGGTLRVWTWLAGATTLALGACLVLAFTQNPTRQIAIVTTTEATVRNGPFEESPTTFTAHDGAELRVLDRKNDWLQVTDGTRRIGWVKRDAMIYQPDS